MVKPSDGVLMSMEPWEMAPIKASISLKKFYWNNIILFKKSLAGPNTPVSSQAKAKLTLVAQTKQDN
jgi:hypothetical protein